MSVNLNSIETGPVYAESVSNGAWAAAIACARAFEPERISAWNGAHDGQEWTPEQLKIMANRIQQTYALIPILLKLSECGGVKIS